MKKVVEEIRPYVIPALLVFIIFMFGKRVMVALGLVPDPTEQKKIDKENEQISKDLQVLQTSGVTSTKPLSYWQGIAELVYQSLRYSGVSDEDETAITAMCTIMNDADFLIVEREFGYRQEYWFGIPNGIKKPLRVFLTDNLSTTERLQINNNYRTKRMQNVV